MNAGARKTLYRAVVVPSWVIFGVLVLIFVSGIEISETMQYVPFALSLVFFGLPHGAVDHLVPGRLSGRGASVASVLGVVLLYIFLSSAYLAVWYVLPTAAFVFFVLITWFHWGQGDLYSIATLLRERRYSSRILKTLTVITRGGLPMLVPLLAFPEVYEQVARSAVQLFSGNTEVGWIFTPDFRWTAGALYAALTIFTLAWGYVSSTAGFKTGWAMDALEVGILAVYFSVVPPILALGMYFSLWHAPRHVARLMLLDRTSEASLEKGTFRPALENFVREAAPLTVVAALLLVGLYFVIPGRIDGLASLLALYLVLISILTLPHVAIVALMDRSQGIWR